MKKTLLAAALAVGFSGVASAQTSVTLYGIIDAGLSYLQFKNKATGQKATRIGGTRDGDNAAGSRWGLRGSEDLGNGLRAIYQLENGFDIFTGQFTQGGRMFGRAAFLGLQNDAWGTVRFGRYFNFATTLVHDVIGAHGDQFAEGNIGATFKSVRQVRYDNYLSYESPVFSGFKFGVGYTFHTGTNPNLSDAPQPWKIDGLADPRRTAFTTAMRYTNGPLVLAASYDMLSKRDNFPTEKDIKTWIVGASYDFSAVKLHLGYGQEKNGVLSPRLLPPEVSGSTGWDIGTTQRLQNRYTPDGYKTNIYSVGLGVPTSAGLLTLNWASSRLGSSKYKDDSPKHSQTIYSVGLRKSLTKRTSVHVFGAHGTGYAFNDVTVTHLVAGMTHMF